MIKRELPSGAKLFLVDDLGPEDSSMVQALYSRSADSVERHLEKVRQSGSARFCEKFLVNYGHKSIADCGSTTLFLEGVSLLAAKAFEDWPLYSGQETSTRYIDMSKQRIVDPLGTDRSGEILAGWMDFYTSSQDRVADTIRKRHPKLPNEDEATYERAIKARTFDSLRGFLPSGITTQFSWHTNLRQAGDHLIWLTRHPLEEVGALGTTLREMLREGYPSSGLGMSLHSVAGMGREGEKERSDWEQSVANQYTYTADLGFPHETTVGFYTSVTPGNLSPYTWALQSRPKGSVLPHL